MTLVILAAGYAVRLQPLTLNTSKSLLTIGGRKILDRIMEKVLSVKEVSSVYIITNARFFENFLAWRKASKAEGQAVSILNDGTLTNETRLGAVQDIAFAIKERSIADDMMVVAGDNLFDFDLNRFVEFAGAHSDGVSVALHDIADIMLAKNFGVVGVDKDNKVIDFEEKPEKPKSTLVSTGIYYFPKDKLSYIREYVKMRNHLDAPGYYIAWLAKRDKIYGFKFTEDWYDIGNIESYKKADAEYLKKERNR
ncbi:MAG: nucleotidyltransferase family protein [Candidatus Omnitrophica bacterium]|nr:nucleotidyltransferase family protein [Candidatus Omnitrophota bacterium]